MIFRLSLGNTLTDQLLCLHFVLPPPNFLRGITFSQLGHRGIDARTMIDCYMDCTSANYKADTAQHHIVLRQDAASATNTTGRSRTVLNRIVLVAKGGTQMLESLNQGFKYI
nr:MAG TPA: hypothetical protein [Caudoviricetes sp.]